MEETPIKAKRFDDAIIETIQKSLKDMAFADIERASKGEAKMGAFILASCFIDYLSCYYYGKDSSGGRYIGFAKRYLPMYNARSLYHDLRCKLVHNYTEGGSFIFIDNTQHMHLRKTTDGKQILNLENFVSDIENAMNKYFDLLNRDGNARIKAINRYINARILSVFQIDQLLPPNSPPEG